MKAAILTAGCRLNQAESDALRTSLAAQGIRVVSRPADADRCYINTCTVTAAADRSSVQLVRRACRLRPKPEVFVLGCLAERAPDRLAGIDGVDEVWSEARKQAELARFGPTPTRSRATLKVQDGCDRGCAYCAPSMLRGAPESLAPDEAARRFDRLVEDGFGEVVLSGLNVGAYRNGTARGLAGLLERLLARPGRFRLRIGSLEPDTVDDALLAVMVDRRVCPHFHLPLQSGDDALLARMGRRYDSRDYRRTVERILAVRPDANLGADVIAGLPGETGESFERTRALVDDLPLGYLHAFSFSPRPGTRAAVMAGAVPPAERRRRVAVLRRLSQAKRNHYRTGYVGKTRDAVVESESTALTDNYLRLALGPDVAAAPRSIVELRIGMDGVRLRGFPPSRPDGGTSCRRPSPAEEVR